MPGTLMIQSIIDEIGIHAAIAGLDHIEYGAFTSSILLLSTLDHVGLAMAFCNEDLKHQASSTSTAVALSAAQKKGGNMINCTVCNVMNYSLSSTNIPCTPSFLGNTLT